MLRYCSDTNLSSLRQTGTKLPEKRGGYGETRCNPNVGRAHAVLVQKYLFLLVQKYLKSEEGMEELVVIPM